MKTKNVLNAIAALNLESIKTKLMDAEHGEGWSRAKVDAMDLEYRRFLHLMHTFPNQFASPTKAVDTFWHYHILDTQKYAADCDEVFGCFMHHNPNGDEGRENTGVSSGDRMQELYEATFGEAYIRPEAYHVEDGSAGSAWGAKTAICRGTYCMMQAKPAVAKAAVLTRSQTLGKTKSKSMSAEAVSQALHFQQKPPARQSASLT